MAEQFLTLMADYDDASQRVFAQWGRALVDGGFIGAQTRDIPYHISLATFPLDKEEEAVALTRHMAEKYAPVTVSINHLGIFPGGRVIFAAPRQTPELTALQEACGVDRVGGYPWTPHTTLLIDEPETVARAVPTLVEVFRPLRGTITKLHLCAFWPTREILTADLQG